MDGEFNTDKKRRHFEDTLEALTDMTKWSATIFTLNSIKRTIEHLCDDVIAEAEIERAKAEKILTDLGFDVPKRE